MSILAAFGNRIKKLRQSICKHLVRPAPDQDEISEQIRTVRQWKAELDCEVKRSDLYGQRVRALISLRFPHADTPKLSFPERLRDQHSMEELIEQSGGLEKNPNANCKEVGRDMN